MWDIYRLKKRIPVFGDIKVKDDGMNVFYECVTTKGVAMTIM